MKTGKRYAYRACKRCFDILLALLLGLLTLPFQLIFAFVIFCHDGKNPFFAQRRVGKNGREFHIFKLRTMCYGADKLEQSLSAEQRADYGREYKLTADPRFLGAKEGKDPARSFGAFLRRTSIDELPQLLLNVLPGTMSMVGPRPVLKEEMEAHYSEDSRALLTSVAPGLTGYWQAYVRGNGTYESGKRQEMELYYVAHASLGFDLRILLKTVVSVLRKTGAS